MDKKELAAMLDGRQYGNEVTKDIEQLAKDNNLVIVFAYSDDNMELKGAIDDEFGCCDGDTAYLTKEGLFEECEDNCKYSQAAKEKTKTIETVWCEGGIPWTYKTDIPHETFWIYEDGEIFCQGIVFSVEDLEG